MTTEKTLKRLIKQFDAENVIDVIIEIAQQNPDVYFSADLMLEAVEDSIKEDNEWWEGVRFMDNENATMYHVDDLE